MCLGLFKKKEKKKDMSWFVGFANFTNIQITPPKFVWGQIGVFHYYRCCNKNNRQKFKLYSLS